MTESRCGPAAAYENIATAVAAAAAKRRPGKRCRDRKGGRGRVRERDKWWDNLGQLVSGLELGDSVRSIKSDTIRWWRFKNLLISSGTRF